MGIGQRNVRQRLLFQIGQVDDLDGTSQDRLIDPAGFFELLDLVKSLGIGEDLVDAVLRFLFLLEVFVLAGDVGVPPGNGGGLVEGPNLGLVGLYELTGPGRGLRSAIASGRLTQPLSGRLWPSSCGGS